MTRPSRRALTILDSLVGRGVRVDAVVLDRGGLRPPDMVRRTRGVWRRGGPADAYRRMRRRVTRAMSRRQRAHGQRYTDYASVVHTVSDINSEESRRLLESLSPDVVVLGSSRILKPPVIEIPTWGVLNAHPGLLPAYRGVDVIHWALRNGDPLGVTVHRVDAGIDTGPILARRTYEIEPGDTVGSIKRRAFALAGDMMADVVRRIAADEPLEEMTQDRSASRLYGRMTPLQRREVEEGLRAR
ncbi:MAG TPA: formyltransferase family protein [Acidimicrobiia bacterium]|nr:formyltransferase family protein [Acidimicrobiia bacterium]